jgi:hypothetical protein
MKQTTFPAILDVLTTQWMSREEIERAVGGPCMSQLSRLYNEGRILHMVDATTERWTHKYALPHKFGDVLIGTGRPKCPCCGRTAA